MDRQEGYYWVKYKDYGYHIMYYINNTWFSCGKIKIFKDSDFEHINEVRIKFPGELPD